MKKVSRSVIGTGIVKEIGASTIEMEECTSEKKFIALIKMQKLSEELKTEISSKYLINTQLLIPEP